MRRGFLRCGSSWVSCTRSCLPFRRPFGRSPWLGRPSAVARPSSTASGRYAAAALAPTRASSEAATHPIATSASAMATSRLRISVMLLQHLWSARSRTARPAFRRLFWAMSISPSRSRCFMQLSALWAQAKPACCSASWASCARLSRPRCAGALAWPGARTCLRTPSSSTRPSATTSASAQPMSKIGMPGSARLVLSRRTFATGLEAT
mmetsp:Transcript_167309/g.537411  ORF Transcript_167309/g.537411 Transcript_167309/m.537411 type:complete len:208 (-) Transcript_167309:2520-3143(-)